MQLISAPIHPPGCCCVCRTTPKGPYLDLGQVVDREQLYLCPACIAEAKRVLGVTDATSDDAEAEGDAAESTPAGTDGVTCPVCGKVCANEFGLRGHMRSHDKGGDA